MADSGWLVRYRSTVYFLATVAVLFGALARAETDGMPIGAAVYVFVLFALCSAPLLLLKRLNGRYALLAIFLAVYFLFFGALDLRTVLLGPDVAIVHPRGADLLTSAELAILTGAAAALVGYLAGNKWGDSRAQQPVLAEWPASSLLFVGITIWLAGTLAMVYFEVFVIPSKLGFDAAKGQASVSPLVTFMLMLGHMMQPVGILMLAYGYAKYVGFLWYPLILAVVALQVAVGFVMDIKMQAMMGGVLVIMARTMVTNRLPKGWIAGGLVFLVIAFPIFQAYRAEVTGERGLDREQALRQLDKVLDIVLASRDKVTVGHERAETFLERASSKNNLEILFAHVGYDVPLLHGRSLVAIPMAFVPRLLVPDKEDISVGMLFGKQILKADSGVFISISHLGELYWNFGWSGVVFGMLGFGALLGFVGAKFNLEHGVTLTRVLVLLATVQPLCLGFGGTMPVSYLVWMRSMAAIGLLHLVFARRAVPAADVPDSALAAGEPAQRSLRTEVVPRGLNVGGSVALAAPVPRFPNLLR